MGVDWDRYWAELDKEDAASEPCNAIARDMIMPHIEKSVYHLASTMPELSNATPKPDRTVVWVTYFRVKNSTVFNATVKEIGTAVKAVEGDVRGTWYSFIGGGENDPDYFVSNSYKDFAEMDVKRDGVWKIMENKHGLKTICRQPNNADRHRTPALPPCRNYSDYPPLRQPKHCPVVATPTAHLIRSTTPAVLNGAMLADATDCD